MYYMCKWLTCNNSDKLEDNDQEIFQQDKSDVGNYTWHYLVSIFILKTVSKMSGICVI